jgi:hypothetical protein
VGVLIRMGLTTTTMKVKTTMIYERATKLEKEEK